MSDGRGLEPNGGLERKGPSSAPGAAGDLARRLVDSALEATVVLGFSRVGYSVRRRLWRWDDDELRLDGRTVLVTGGSSGLGFAYALRAASSGASVCITGRDPRRLGRARDEVRSRSGGRPVEAEVVDMADLTSVGSLVGRFRMSNRRLHVLVHNAGSLSHEFTRGPEGIESTVCSHVVGPFLLTLRLLPELQAAAPSRVIVVTSGGMYTQRLLVRELEMSEDSYNGTVAYARAKRAQVALARLWNERFGGSGLMAHAADPGWADTRGLRLGLPGFYRLARPILRTPEQGADTPYWLSCSPEPAREGGRLWMDRRPRWAHKLPWTAIGDTQSERDRLWSWCSERAGLVNDDNRDR